MVKERMGRYIRAEFTEDKKKTLPNRNRPGKGKPASIAPSVVDDAFDRASEK